MSYFELSGQSPSQENTEEILSDDPIEFPDFDFDRDYSCLKKERDDLEAQIRELKQAIAQEKDDFAAKYDALVNEQQEITDAKCQEANDLRTEIQKVKSEIHEAKNWNSLTDEINQQLEQLRSKCDEVDSQEQIFIDELVRYTKGLSELGSTGYDLLMSSKRLPKFKSETQREAALLSQSLYTLRMALIRRYAESIDCGCGVE